MTFGNERGEIKETICRANAFLVNAGAVLAQLKGEKDAASASTTGGTVVSCIVDVSSQSCKIAYPNVSRKIPKIKKIEIS